MKAQLLVGLAAFTALAGVAMADDISQANGLAVTTRLWNDFGTSNLTVDGTGRAQVREDYAKSGLDWHVNEKFAAGTVGNYANKHIAYLSKDGGATAMGLHASQSWVLDLDIKISAPNGAPRKEGAIQIENPRPGLGYTDEGRILVASDGEVAVFGGVMPFTGFGNNVYTRNTTAHLRFEFYAPGAVDAVLGGYRLIFTDAVTGVHDSGIKLWGASEPDGTTGFNEGTRLGLVVQNQRNPFINDESDFMFSNVTVVPAPGTIGLMGLIGLAASRRRR